MHVPVRDGKYGKVLLSFLISPLLHEVFHLHLRVFVPAEGSKVEHGWRIDVGRRDVR